MHKLMQVNNTLHFQVPIEEAMEVDKTPPPSKNESKYKTL